MAISHIFTNPVPDGTITSIVRPSDWNSAHNQYYTLSGNVLGASTVSGTNVVLQAAGNVSLSGVNQTIIISGSNTPQPTSYVSNVNGISGQVSLNAGSSLSASTNGSSITFGLASNITTALQPAGNYLTTQTVQTQASGAIAGTGFTSTTTAGTAITGALGTNGINLGIPAYLTTARASNDGVGLNTAQTNVTWTVSSNGISLNAGAYLTTQTVQTQASGNIVGSGFTSTTTAGTAVVGTQNSQGLSLGIPAYLTTQTVQTQASGNIVGSGFNSTTTTGTAIVGTLNTNGLSLGVPAFITAGGGGNFSGGVSNLGNTAGSTGITGTRIVFVGTNNISLSQSTDVNGATISINQTGGGGGGIAAAAGGQTATSGTVNFANSNGITFGMSQSSQITASYTVPSMQVNLSGNTAGNSTASGSTLNFSGINVTLSGTNNSQIAISAPATSGITAGNNISLSSNGNTIGISAQAVALGASTQTATSGTVNFANSNGISFGMSGSNQITASYTQLNQAFSASGGSSSFQTLNFANSNGITFTNTNASVAITHDLQYTSNTSNITSNAFPSADTTKFAGTGTTAVNATVTLNSNGINISVAAPGGGGNFSGGVSNLGNTAGSTGITGTRIVFVGTNNISLSQSTDANGATISFDQTGGGGGAMYANLSGATSGNTTASGNTLNFSGINVTLSGTNNSQIAISAPATTALVAGNNISLSANASTVTVRAQAVAVSAGAQVATSGTLLFSDANGISFGMSGSSRITASYTQRTTYAFSASGGSSSWATLNFANSNGVTFSNSGGSVVASYTVPATTGFAGTGFTSTTTVGTAITAALGTDGLSMAVPAFITAGGGGGNFSGGVSDLGNTAGSTGITGTRIVFVGTNNISLSQSTDANGATISINQTGGGGGGAMYANLLGATSGNSTASGNTLAFSGINITLSGTNNSQIALSVPPVSSIVAGDGLSISTTGSTISIYAPVRYESGYSPHGDYPLVVGQIGQGTLALDPDIFPDLTVDRLAIPINFSHASNSTGSFTVSNWIGLYTRNASSISLAHSTSFSTGITFSGTQNSVSHVGWRNLTYGWSTSISGGRYWIAQIVSTTTGGANCSFSQYLASQVNTNFSGDFGAATNASAQFTLGQGFYSAATGALPGSIAFTQIRGTNSLAQRFPIVQFGFNSV